MARATGWDFADSIAFAVYPTGSWYIDNSGPQGANSNVVLAINTALTAAGVPSWSATGYGDTLNPYASKTANQF